MPFLFHHRISFILSMRAHMIEPQALNRIYCTKVLLHGEAIIGRRSGGVATLRGRLRD
jgi:hypothetical protein